MNGVKAREATAQRLGLDSRTRGDFDAVDCGRGALPLMQSTRLPWRRAAVCDQTSKPDHSPTPLKTCQNLPSLQGRQSRLKLDQEMGQGNRLTVQMVTRYHWLCVTNLGVNMDTVTIDSEDWNNLTEMVRSMVRLLEWIGCPETGNQILDEVNSEVYEGALNLPEVIDRINDDIQRAELVGLAK